MSTNTIDTEKATTPETGAPKPKGKGTGREESQARKEGGPGQEAGGQTDSGSYQQKGRSDRAAEAGQDYGGPIVTVGGLVFIAATNHDRKFRAFDKTTGELLWETTLPLSGNATPITYQLAGRQYVVICATGGKGRDGKSGGIYVAFALPTDGGRP